MSESLKGQNKFCYFLYELAIVMAFSILILAPIHSTATRHYNINKILSPSSVEFTAKDTSFLSPGDILPVYRFNPDWTSEIGRVKVLSINQNQVRVTFDPQTFRWPMGRQGVVVDVQNSRVKISMGENLALKVGDLLCLYKDRKMVGKVRLQEVASDYSWGEIERLTPGTSLMGLTVSEFIYVTQVAFLKNPFVTIFEIVFIVGVLLTQLYYFFILRSPLLIVLGGLLQRTFQLIPKEPLYLTVNLLLGIPFVWFMVNFFPRCFIYLGEILLKIIQPITHHSFNLYNLYFWFHQNIVNLYIVGGGIYLSVFIWKRTSPIIVFWQWVRYKPKESKFFKGVVRDIIHWIFLVIIFYAFGSALFGFLRSNLAVILNLIWPNEVISWRNFSDFLHLSKPRVLVSHELIEIVFLVLRYLLWSITIVGCLLGYWYSILGYFYGKKVRDLDFTTMGWLTNAVCYGSLLGVIISQMTPSLRGLDPILTGDYLHYFVMLTELFLNLFYTISIWNLGTMFGVMTDKGVRTSGFYSVVRHPSYTLEATMFVMVFLNGLSTHYQWWAVAMFLLTYYIRSEREDQFMAASNPEYKVYQQQTKYKFIPGLY